MSTRAYVDLLFAWAHARLGEPARARDESEEARARLPTTSLHQWLGTAFRHRIDQAIRGESHSGEWPAGLLASLNTLDNRVLRGVNPEYVVDQLRCNSRILEPDLGVDPYSASKRFASEVHRRIWDLQRRTAPADFTPRFDALLFDTRGSDKIVERLELIRSTASALSQL